MNNLLYIGLVFLIIGFLLFVISIIMERHYEIKFWKLKNQYELLKVKPKIKNDSK